MANIKDIKQGGLYEIIGTPPKYIAVTEVSDDFIKAYSPSEDGTVTINASDLAPLKLKKVKPLKFRKGDEITITNGSSILLKVKGGDQNALTIEFSGNGRTPGTKTLSAVELSALLMQIGNYRRTNPRLRKVGKVIAVVTIAAIAGVVWYKNR
jgi:hypothetical protein